MIFTETRLKGAFIVEPEKLFDERGFFARTYCAREFNTRGLHDRWAQCSIAYNQRGSTLRGMHFQTAPHEEIKLVRCTQGAVHDVIVDLRPDSLTYRAWVAVKLTAENRRMLYIPVGFAHGYLTLEDDVELFYQISESYHAGCARGIRWDDPAIGIEWPGRPAWISPRDQAFARLAP